MKLTIELYEFIKNECKKFKEETWGGNDVDVNDVIYSYLYSTKETFYTLKDWDEGELNDPFWNKKLNQHSAIVFLKEMRTKIDNYYT